MKRSAAAVVVLGLLLSLSACDPYPPAATNGVWLDARIGADGSATVDVHLDDSDRSPSRVRAIGEEVGRRLFPDASSVTVRVDSNGGGFPFAVVDAAGVYRPGPRPRVAVDTRDAVRGLVDQGTRTVEVTVDAGAVPATASWAVPAQPQEVPGSWSWSRVTDAAAAPSGVVVLRPQPWRGAGTLLASVVALALLLGSVLVFRRRGRRPAIVLSLASVAVLALEAAPLLGVRVDDLAAAGVLGRPWSGLASGFVTAAFLVVPVGLVLPLVYAALGHRRAPSVPART